jgi:hypothetical protein
MGATRPQPTIQEINHHALISLTLRLRVAVVVESRQGIIIIAVRPPYRM